MASSIVNRKTSSTVTVKDARKLLGNADSELRELKRLFELEFNRPSDQATAVKVRLIDFVAEFWKVVEPRVKFQQTWHIELIAEYLEAFHRGEIKRLIINCPPRCGKSLLCSVMYPAWAWSQNPEQRFICVSYADGLALKFSLQRLLIIQSKPYQEKWGNLFSFDSSQNSKRYRLNNRQGYFYSAPLQGQITGYGANRIIIDDPNPLEDAVSKATRDAAWEIGYNTISSRLDDVEKDGIVVTQQRIHREDNTGKLTETQGVIEAGGEWYWVKIPANYDGNPARSFGSIADPRTIIGESFWPEKFPNKELEKIRANVGEFYFASQYQQTPVARQGGIFKQDWFADKILDLEPTPYQLLLTNPDLTHVRSWDLAASDEKLSSDPDYTVGLRAAMSQDGDIYVFGMERFRKVPGETYQTIVSTAAIDGHQTAIIIEQEKGGSSSVALSGMAARLAAQGYIAKPIPVKGSKEHRAELASVQARLGKIYLVRSKGSPNHWVHDFFDEILTFPKSPHKDITDAFSHAVIYLTERNRLYAVNHYGTVETTMDGASKRDDPARGATDPNALWQ
jgi:predicted phage terminase large subunit-like protein